MEKVIQKYDTSTPAQGKALWNKINDLLGDCVYNPILQLPGVAKYPLHDLMGSLSPLKPGTEKYSTLAARWQSFDMKGLNILPVIPSTLIQYYKSLVGKEF
ncbi:hypothetical protein CROQUDRAFT_93725 [Cronartium quercuum f. sp. fusiforme G11]|uniref:Uncharacterized protein n=1 Tax=Cronartium quercuum f. sp. fusiforme G11 TaxID=708437 RepID=A0A9P6TAQ8_9BASI|nr:hypothetical protein CROQUDRAFT_93725 [Cronartium quercuum f. sp. fusiforme G11]